MSNNELITKIKSLFRKDSKQLKAFELLSDQEWHCREHDIPKKLDSRQYAGGGGIQGLQRGNRSGRRGLVIETENKYCHICNCITKWDRWTGEVKEANAPANVPSQLIEKILQFYSYTDIVENRDRYAHECKDSGLILRK